jgi:hypothetical protein
MAVAKAAPVKPAATVTVWAPSPFRLISKERLPAALVVADAAEPTTFPCTPVIGAAEFRLAARNAKLVAFGEAVVDGRATSPIDPVIVPVVSARNPRN